ncbi:hypothetical protein CCHR01_11908 [Colletotrichum chrysophilum]|uniref:Uncharacterized protein n=1 Tax=Colletotrichum chrysophilum TaxID=1836956 RepID=A0AAD9EEB0_9PEZI|nr:hypothetical protein CCHR01_11908 [Colletotrichum chrysophilum]
MILRSLAISVSRSVSVLVSSPLRVCKPLASCSNCWMRWRRSWAAASAAAACSIAFCLNCSNGPRRDCNVETLFSAVSTALCLSDSACAARVCATSRSERSFPRDVSEDFYVERPFACSCTFSKAFFSSFA